MSLSLIGVIFMQGYWIKKSIDDTEEQFSHTVSQVLANVSEKIENREIKDYFDKWNRLQDSLGQKPDEFQFKEILAVLPDKDSDEILVYQHGILEEVFNVPSTLFDNVDFEDSTRVTSYSREKIEMVYKDRSIVDNNEYTNVPISKIYEIGNTPQIEMLQYEESFRDIATRIPMHKRVSKEEISILLSQEFKDRGLKDLEFEFGIYSSDLPTKVKTRKFKQDNSSVYKAPIFKDGVGESDFSLLISFPEERKFIVSSIAKMGILTFLFTIVILLTYMGAIYQLIKQKKISEIKTDFINNMTHEFKTPIATINLAVEAIKNPTIISDKEKVGRYLKMIRDENKRMHAQVENVLRISKLEKNQLDISKERVDVHDIIEDAKTHVELIAQDRGGYVNLHLDAKRSDVLANEMHFTNVIVNIMDNAIKYSPESPKVDVFTETVKNYLIIKVVDQGAGMGKAVLKKVFEKFYREHTGNIHNVKGHGLGLSYVKNIVENHQGIVYAESEKGKGSTFYIKLPLI